MQDWDGGKTAQAQVAYVLGYVLAFVFLCLFFFLFIFRSAAKRLYIDPKLKKREEEEARAVEEQALLRAQLEQQQKAGAVAAAPAEGKKPEAAGSEKKPDAAVKVCPSPPANRSRCRPTVVVALAVAVLPDARASCRGRRAVQNRIADAAAL